MLEVLAAALVQLPAPDISTVRAVLRDIEPASIRQPISGARVRAFADEKGKVRDCVVISFAGTQDGANALCRAYEGKKVKPAADTDGTSISGFMETVIWVTPGPDTTVPTLPDRVPDAQLTVERLPEGLSDPFRLTIGLIIDEAGAIAACGPVKAEHQALVLAACKAVEGQKFSAVQDESGGVTRYARPFDVGFTTQSGAPEEP